MMSLHRTFLSFLSLEPQSIEEIAEEMDQPVRIVKRLLVHVRKAGVVLKMGYHPRLPGETGLRRVATVAVADEESLALVRATLGKRVLCPRCGREVIRKTG